MEIILLIVLLLVSAFFSGTETALFSLGEGDVDAVSRQHGRFGRGVRALLDDTPRLLSALLIGNLLVNIISSVVATSMLVRKMGPGGVAVAVPLMTVVLLMVGEIAPKLTALRYRRGLSIRALPVIRVWLLILRPLLDLSSLGTRMLLRALPGETTSAKPLSTEELATAADLAVSDGVLSQTEGRFLARLLRLEDLEVREVMTPRTEVISLVSGQGRGRILVTARAAGFNRYPVFAADHPLPIGFMHLKDLLAHAEDTDPLVAGLRDPLFVPESKTVRSLLGEMRIGGSHMAFVVDEHGDFTGVVTLEDCLEALTGPWADESDIEGPDLMPVGDGVWVIDGGADLRRVNEICGTGLEASRDFVTVGGMLMAMLGRIPESGDEAEAGGARFTVIQMDGHRVDRVRVLSIFGDAERGRS